MGSGLGGSKNWGKLGVGATRRAAGGKRPGTLPGVLLKDGAWIYGITWSLELLGELLQGGRSLGLLILMLEGGGRWGGGCIRAGGGVTEGK